MNPRKALNSNSLETHERIGKMIEEYLSPMDCILIPFAQVERQPESKWTVKDPDGISHEFSKQSEVTDFLIYDCELYESCREYIFENYDTRPSGEEQELEWVREIAWEIAKEKGYEVKS